MSLAQPRILRCAELSGHDPGRVLLAAVAERPLDGARNVTSVPYRRIADQHSPEASGNRAPPQDQAAADVDTDELTDGEDVHHGDVLTRE